jgi:predicted transcriptional regulator
MYARTNMKTASFRLDESEDAEIEDLARRMKTDKSSAARRAITKGIREIKREEAIDMVRRQEWTVWRAATYCGESYRSFLRLLRLENVPFPVSTDEIRRELDDLRSQ